MKLTNQPITGAEESNDVASPYSILVDFYAAFNHKNHQKMENNWLQSEEASMSNPLGGVKRGWDEIKQVYKNIFDGPASVYVEFYDYSIHFSNSMFLAAGKERGTLTTKHTQIKLAIRTTRIYTLHKGLWKQTHHHGSIDNPTSLDTYQTTVLEKLQ
jgi:hypothetical protein